MRKFVPAILLTSFLVFCCAVLPAGAAMASKRSVLSNGIVLLSSEQKTLPIISIEILLAAGSRYDQPDQEGIANLTARLLTYGTTKRSALEISDTLDFIGASLSASSGDDVASVNLNVLKKDLSTGLELLADILTSAAFPDQEIERQKQSVLAGIKAREDSPGDIAQKRFAAALYPGSPYGRPVEGNEASVKSIPRESLRNFYERYYRPNRAIIAVVGDISHEEISRELEQYLRSWKPGEAAPRPLVPNDIGGAQTIRVNKELTQANIILGHNGVAREDPDYYAVQVMNYILGGGGFSSRAMDSIRNQRGLAYSVYSYFSGDRSRGMFQFVMQTKNETAQEAIRIAREEMIRMRQELVTDQELSDAKDYLIGSFPLRLDTNRRVASFLTQVEYYQLGLDYPERYPGLIRSVTREDVARVAKKYLDPDRLIVVIVGNQKNIARTQSDS
jgi:zinc protease